MRHVALKTIKRLRHLTWAEVRVRGFQELAKPCDYALYRSGLLRAAARPDTAGAGQFFFSPEELPRVVEYLKQHFPSECAETIAEANRLLRHEFDLLGFRALSHGPRIDWHCDVVHGRRAPRKPWFRIPFLDFDQVGDHKIIWELNRHQHLVTLAKAWLLSGDDRFLTELEAQWKDWHDQNPYPAGINWASSLEVAFRALSWLWVKYLIPRGTARFLQEIDPALALSGRHIERYLSTYFAPNTHLLGEGMTLFSIGVLCPGLARAERWRKLGWSIVLQEAEKQVLADGLHFERSTHYHVYALDFFLHARLLAARNAIPIPARFDERITSMLEVLAGITAAGIPPRMGDDDGGRLFNQRRNEAAHMLDPLPIGTVLYRRPEWKAKLPGFTEEAVWLLGVEGAESFARMKPPEKPAARAFEASGIHVLVTRGERPWQLTMDAGPHGIYGHCHADALSVQLSHEGREWLIDPGTGSYMVGADRRYFRSTQAHNTAVVDGRSQVEDRGPFSWGPPPKIHVERWEAADERDVLAAAHNGYAPVIHRRTAVREQNTFQIRDEFFGSGQEHRIDIRWHWAPGLIVQRGDAPNAFLVTDGIYQVLLLCPPDWEPAIENDVVSPAYGVQREALTLRLSYSGKLPCMSQVEIRAAVP